MRRVASILRSPLPGTLIEAHAARRVGRMSKFPLSGATHSGVRRAALPGSTAASMAPAALIMATPASLVTTRPRAFRIARRVTEWTAIDMGMLAIKTIAATVPDHQLRLTIGLGGAVRAPATTLAWLTVGALLSTSQVAPGSMQPLGVA